MKTKKKKIPTRESEVLRVMRDRKFHTLNEIFRNTQYPESSVSCQLRDFRKAGYEVNKQILCRVGNRPVWTYQLLLKKKA